MSRLYPCEPGGALTTEELDTWADEFAAVHARLADLFRRAEPRAPVAKYLRGLVPCGERKDGWHLAERLGDPTPDRMQRLLYRVDWDADAAGDRLQRFVIERGGAPEGIGVVDETGFLTKGAHAVGVLRQYRGTAGRVETSQVGAFLSYASPRGPVFRDRRLYLPASWCADPLRRAPAKVPAAGAFQTTPQPAAAMLEHAWAQGGPRRWVAGDEVAGDAPARRATSRRQGGWYVLGGATTTPVWTARPVVLTPTTPHGRPRLAPEAPPPHLVAAVGAAWPASPWQRLTGAEGEKGPRPYAWAAARVVASAEHLPGVDTWLLACRAVSDPAEIAYYLSGAPVDRPLVTLARVAATRDTGGQCLDAGKGEAGLDEYAGRPWPRWHRHSTLAVLAHALLAAIRSLSRHKGGRSPQTWPN